MEGVLRFVVYRCRESLEGVSQTHYLFDADPDLRMWGITAGSARLVEPIGVYEVPIGVYEVPIGQNEHPLPRFIWAREVVADGQIVLEKGTLLSYGSWNLSAADVVHGRFVDPESGQTASIRPLWTEGDGPVAR
jgi:hypothetical protein